MYWVRVDNRLIHGQVIETWLPFTDATLIVVANDTLADDELQQEIVSLAIPRGVQTVFAHVNEVEQTLAQARPSYSKSDTLVLFANCQDAQRAFDQGLSFSVINIGNLHYSPGKRQVCSHVAMSDDDESCLKYLKRQGVNLDFRCVPSEPIHIRF